MKKSIFVSVLDKILSSSLFSNCIFFEECNHPNCLYISTEEYYKWSDYNGCAPYRITKESAIKMLSDPDICIHINLEPLNDACRREMEEGLKRRNQ